MDIVIPIIATIVAAGYHIIGWFGINIVPNEVPILGLVDDLLVAGIAVLIWIWYLYSVLSSIPSWVLIVAVIAVLAAMYKIRQKL